MKNILRFCMLVNFLVMITPLQGALSHLMNDAGTTLVFSDDFEDDSYTDKWITYTTASSAAFTQTQGYAKAQIATGETYKYAYFISKNSVDLSANTGKKTELVMAQNNYNSFVYSRTLFVNTQSVSGSGFCIEHRRYQYGDLKLSLYNNGSMITLYDVADLSTYQAAYSFSLVVDPSTGAWSLGWAHGLTGVTQMLASGVLTPEQIATYLSSTLYVATGIYTAGSTDTSNNYNLTFEVEVYQVLSDLPVPVFSPSGPFIVGPTPMTLTSETVGSQIYYTLDGTTPTAQSQAYVGPVMVDNGTVLKAIAVLGGSVSEVTSQTYLVPKTQQSLLNDPGTVLVFSDDFTDGSYTDRWMTYTNAASATFYEDPSTSGGYLYAWIATGETYKSAYFFTQKSFDLSSTSGKKTELAMSQIHMSNYVYNRTLFVNTRSSSGKGFCIEHRRYPTGDIKLSLYNNNVNTVTLFDGIDLTGPEGDHSFSLVVNPQTGDWLFGWARGRGGVAGVLASGTLTANQIASYLSTAMYVGTGIYTSSSTDTSNNINITYRVGVSQVLDVTVPSQPTTMEIDVTLPPYHAIADDGISDRVAIQAAINALPADGGTVYFPAGVYDVDGDLLIYDRDTMPYPLYEKPVFLRGDTYSGAGGGSGSVLRRITTGNILRINLDDTNYGYWGYTKLSVANLGFQGDPNHSGQVTAIRGYRTRMNLQNVSFEDCYNGIYLDGPVGPQGNEYSDTCCYHNLRFYNGWGGDGIRIHGGDSMILNGISMEDCTFAFGINLPIARGMLMSNLMIHGVDTAIRLAWSKSVTILGWNSGNLTSKGLYADFCEGVTVDGFTLEGSGISRFYVCGDTVGLKIQNGRIQGDLGYDLHIFDTSRNVEFDQIELFDAGGAVRGVRMSTNNTAKGKYVATQTDVNGLPFFQLKGSDTTGTVFEIDANGGLTMGGGVRILTGSGSPEGIVVAPRGSLYMRSDGGSNTTIYVKEAGTGATGWVAKYSADGSALLIPGDANNDGMVDVGDLGILAANYGRNLAAEGINEAERWFLGDFNSDGIVDVGDLGILAANYGTGVEVSQDFDADYAAAFETTVADDEATREVGRSACAMMGLPLVAGLLLMGLAAMKWERE